MTAKRRKGRSWSYSAGERGTNRVRVYDRGTRGLYLDYFDETGKRVRSRLGHSDRERAKAQADDLALRFRQTTARPSRLTLEKLFHIYEVEVSAHKGTSKRKHDARAALMFLEFLGKDRDPRTLSRREWDRFIDGRRRGIIRPRAIAKARPVRDRIVEYDLKYLLAVLNWATVAGDGSGAPMLDRNPLKGMPLPIERNPRRPALTAEQYEAMLAVAGEVHPLMQCVLVMAHETGHRIGSIRQLRWHDVDLEHAVIEWRAETDKEGRAHTTPLTVAAVAALTELRRQSAAIGDGWIFPAPEDPRQASSRHLVREWWQRAAKLAKLPEHERFGWHAMRRGWASEMRDVNLRDLCDLGGWRTPTVPLECYIRPSIEAQRAAFAKRRMIGSDARVEGAA